LLEVILFKHGVVNVLLHWDHLVDGLQQERYLALLVFLRLQSVLGLSLPTVKKARKFEEGLSKSL